MCTGLEPIVLASIIGGASTAAAGIMQARNQPKVDAPQQQQPEREPDILALRRRARQGLRPGGAIGSSLLTPPNVSTTTLLGQ